MTTAVYGFCNALGFSSKFCNFKSRHYNFSSVAYNVYNADVSAFSDFELITLHQYTDGVRDSPAPLINEDHLAMYTSVVQWILTESYGGELSLDASLSNRRIGIMFPTATITIGELSVDPNGKIVPEYVEILLTSGDSAKFWLNVSRFSDNYPYGDHVVIPLTSEIDSLFSTTKASLDTYMAELEDLPFQSTFESITEDSPSTVNKVVSTTWVNPNDITISTTIYFGVAIYGVTANTTSAVLEAIRTYIIANSQLSSEQWETTLPDIFNVVSFVIVPSWDRVVKEDGTSTTYNPIANASEVAAFYKDEINFVTDEIVDSKLEALPTVYQSLTTWVCPSDANNVTDASITSVYDDYILAGVVDSDFMYMRPATQAFVSSLVAGLEWAESYSGGNVGSGYDIEIVGDLTFIVFIVGSYRFRIVTKSTFLDKLA